MPPSYIEPFLEPLARLLADSTVTTLFVNGPHDVRVERQGRTEAVHAAIGLDDIEEMVTQVGRRAGFGPLQVQSGCLLASGLRVDLVRNAAVEGGVVLVVSRPRARPRGLEEPFGPGHDGVQSLALLQQALAERRGVLIVAPTELLRGSFVLSVAEELPSQERVVVVDRGQFVAPRHPHLVRLIVDPSSGATRSRLVEAAGTLRAQRLVLDELSGPEVRELLLGEGDVYGGAIVGVEGQTLEAGLERCWALARLMWAGEGDPEALLRARFGLALLLGEGARRRPTVMALADIAAAGWPAHGLRPQLRRVRQQADSPLLEPGGTDPGAAPAPPRGERASSPPQPVTALRRSETPTAYGMAPSLPVLPPPAEGLRPRSVPPAPPGFSPLASAGYGQVTAAGYVPPLTPSPVQPATPPPFQPAERPIRPSAPPPASPAAPPPAPASPVAAASAAERLPLRTVAITRPTEDIFDEMLSSLQDLPPSFPPPAATPLPSPPELGLDEIDDSLLYRNLPYVPEGLDASATNDGGDGDDLWREGE